MAPVCQHFFNTLGIKKNRVQFVMQNFFTTGKLPDAKGVATVTPRNMPL